jgi:flagellar biosynthetic protein FlhB
MKIVIKLTVLLTIVIFMIKFEIVKIENLYTYPHETLLAQIGITLFYLILVILIGSLCFALFDYGYNWFSLEKKMKMTKQELKEEIKKSEGDPAIKGRRRSFGRDLVLRKSLQDSEKATFVVTNPDHYAVAIRYVTGMNAPIILAKGVNFLAEKIKSIAKKHDIIIVENKPLARTLYKTSKIGEEVPQSLYQPLIEVMKYIYQIKGKDYFEKHKQISYEV